VGDHSFYNSQVEGSYYRGWEAARESMARQLTRQRANASSTEAVILDQVAENLGFSIETTVRYTA
jgi:hypothetical protein